MRTTTDLPDDLYRQASSIARDTSRTLSETVADLMRRGLGQDGGVTVQFNPITGLPLVRLGHVLTTDDVRSLQDDDS